MTSVVVVGAGVIGLSTALHLLERFSRGTLDLTVVSDKFSPDITSNKAAALIFPANSQGTTGSCVNGSTRDNASGSNGHPKLSPRNAVLDDRMRRWSVETLRKFHTLHRYCVCMIIANCRASYPNSVQNFRISLVLQ